MEANDSSQNKAESARALAGRKPLPEWNAELNRRRCELIDGSLRGTLSHAEQLELVRLTELMREHVDSETHLPLEGAEKLLTTLTRQQT